MIDFATSQPHPPSTPRMQSRAQLLPPPLHSRGSLVYTDSDEDFNPDDIGPAVTSGAGWAGYGSFNGNDQLRSAWSSSSSSAISSLHRSPALSSSAGMSPYVRSNSFYASAASPPLVPLSRVPSSAPATARIGRGFMELQSMPPLVPSHAEKILATDNTATISLLPPISIIAPTPYTPKSPDLSFSSPENDTQPSVRTVRAGTKSSRGRKRKVSFFLGQSPNVDSMAESDGSTTLSEEDADIDDIPTKQMMRPRKTARRTLVPLSPGHACAKANASETADIRGRSRRRVLLQKSPALEQMARLTRDAFAQDEVRDTIKTARPAMHAKCIQPPTPQSSVVPTMIWSAAAEPMILKGETTQEVCIERLSLDGIGLGIANITLFGDHRRGSSIH
ncbi:hypothetical protein EMMF5_002283 [Cystobasidiomycetes sp. EMM_F5]